MATPDVPGRKVRPSGLAVGITFTAAFILIFAGFFGNDSVQGIVGRINDEFYVVIHKWVFQLDTTTRGPLAPVLPVVALLITPSTYS
jgi:hypothetical protein